MLASMPSVHSLKCQCYCKIFWQNKVSKSSHIIHNNVGKKIAESEAMKNVFSYLLISR